MKNIHLILFVLISLVFNVIQAEDYTNKNVSEIIINNKVEDSAPIDTDSLKNKLLTKTNGHFSQDDFDTDLKVLAKRFSQVNPNIQNDDNGLKIILDVWPKPMIHSISWNGYQKIKVKKLKNELSINSYTEFDPYIFNQAVNKIKNYYIKKGFFEAQLEYKVEHNESKNEVNIYIDIEEGRIGKIKDLSFVGINKKEEADILSNISTKKYNMLTSWYSSSGNYNEDMIEMDKLAITDYFNNKGYADASIDIDLVENKKEDSVSVKITAQKGAKYIFEKISISGNTLFEENDIKKQLSIKSGDEYSEDAIRRSIQKIYTLYGKYGYIETNVYPQTKLIKGENSYSVKFEIEEGLQYRVGLIKIAGNYTTHNKVILHETLLAPGEIFNIRKLRATESKLHNIGYFKNVNVYTSNIRDVNNLGSEFRDVIIEVEEVSTGSVGLSVGFSSSDSAFVGLDVLERNFNIKGLPNIFSEGYQALRGAGEYAHLKLNVGKKQRTYLASWMKPFFMDTQWTISLDLEKNNNRYQSDFYDIDTLTFGINAYYNINQFLKFGCRYEIEDSELMAREEASQEIRDREDNNGFLSTIGTSLIYDSTDSPNNPSQGFRSKFLVDYAGLGGKSTFMKFGYLNSYYTPLLNNGVLKYTLDLNFIDTLGTDLKTLPMSEFLFLGGEDSVRGFESYTIGPKDSTGRPIGGVSSTFMSLEYLYQAHNKIGLFSFIDSGYISRKQYDFDTLRTSVGAGLRIEIFPNAPPISIGYGFPINPKDPSDEKRFFLALGAQF